MSLGTKTERGGEEKDIWGEGATSLSADGPDEYWRRWLW